MPVCGNELALESGPTIVTSLSAPVVSLFSRFTQHSYTVYRRLEYDSQSFRENCFRLADHARWTDIFNLKKSRMNGSSTLVRKNQREREREIRDDHCDEALLERKNCYIFSSFIQHHSDRTYYCRSPTREEV